MRNTITTLAIITTLGACVVENEPSLEDEEAVDEETYSSQEQAIQDGSLATAWQRDRAIDLQNCTGTRISSRHVLTALHCDPQVGQVVFGYGDTSTHSDTSKARTIVAVARPPGTNWDYDDWTDSSGEFADMAIVTLSSPADWGSSATLAWTYPGDDHYGYKVGRGNHEGDPNPDAELRYRGDYTYSDSDDGGGFLTNQAGVDPGDSGGPYYYGNRVLGTLTGKILDLVWRGRHCSVPEHLSWILSAIGWTWPHGTVQNDFVRSGAILGVMYRSERICQYACDHTGSCVAYNHYAALNMCQMLSTVTGGSSADGWRSDAK